MKIYAFLCCICLCACSQSTTSTRLLPQHATSQTILENFTYDSLWTLGGAGNHADLTWTANEGLHVRAYQNGRTHAIIRKEVDWDLSSIDALYLNIHNAGTNGSAHIHLAFRDEKRIEYSTTAYTLQTGWNKHIRFDLDTLANKNLAHHWSAQRRHVTRALILIETTADTEPADLHISQLSYTGQAQVRIAPPILFQDRTVSATTVARYQPFEISARVNRGQRSAFPPDYQDHMKRFLPNMLDARLLATDPRGTTHIIPGFCSGLDPDGFHTYTARLSPWISGIWHCRLQVRSGDRWDSDGKTIALHCNNDDYSMSPMTTEQNVFVNQQGELFYPRGQNLCWAGDYEPWFDTLAANGGNWARIWICSWNLDLSNNGDMSTINFTTANELDRIFELAEARGIRIQLCIFYHAMLGWDWQKSPFHKTHSGHIDAPENFWTDWRCKQQCRELLSYISARWGHSPALFAWELFNEANLTHRWKTDDIVTWHQEMYQHLRAVDPHKHMITTSTHRVSALPELWNIPFDFVGAHRYHPNSTRASSEVATHMKTDNRPHFLAEAGDQSREHTAQHDVNGYYLRQALWETFCHGHAGGPMPWWWDVHINPQQHLRFLKNFTDATAGFDPRGRTWRTITTHINEQSIATMRISDNEAWIHVYNPEQVTSDQTLPPPMVLPHDETLSIAGLSSGTWMIEQIDPCCSTDTSTQEQQVVNGQLELSLSATTHSIVLHLTKETLPQPALFLKEK